MGRAAMRRENEDPTTREGREQEAGGSQTPGGRLGSPGALRGGSRRDREIGPDRSGCLCAIGDVTGRRQRDPCGGHPGPRRSVLHPQNMAPKNGAPPGPCDFFVQRFPFELVAPSFSSSCPRLRLLVFLSPRFLLQAALMGPLESTSIHEHPVRCTGRNRSWVHVRARACTSSHEHPVRCTGMNCSLVCGRARASTSILCAAQV